MGREGRPKRGGIGELISDWGVEREETKNGSRDYKTNKSKRRKENRRHPRGKHSYEQKGATGWDSN